MVINFFWILASWFEYLEAVKHSVVEESGMAEESNVEECRLAAQSNVEEFQSLQKNDKWGTFFYTFDKGELEMSDKPFAMGAQAEIYEAEVKWRNPNWRKDLMRENVGDPTEYVLKVFKEGTYLRDLKSNLPPAMLDFHAKRAEAWLTRRRICDVVCGTLLKNGRFAFVLQKEQKDLRRLIDDNMESRNEQGRRPFSKEVAENFSYEVALGMEWLHEKNIVHRDLKASNVLVREDRNWNYCFIADYECSIRILGTGFWMAPEILQVLKNKVNEEETEKVFTKKVDVYAYGMTCYEILTGKIPKFKNKDDVLNGQFLQVPEHVPKWMRELLMKCWQFDPTTRPSFQDIRRILENNSAVVKAHLNVASNVAHDKTIWSYPKTQIFTPSEVRRLLRMKKQYSKSYSKKREMSEDDQRKELEAQIHRRKQYQREDVLKSLQESEWVFKVFKKGTLMRDLTAQFPRGMLEFNRERMEPPKVGTTLEWKKPQHVVDTLCGTLLSDGRFGLLMRREQEDLRSLIDRRMIDSNHYAPFAKEVSKKIMHDIALGVDWLHSYETIHRDLKSSNVLVNINGDGEYECLVTDYECSVGVVGTGFFRAPEILQACKDRTILDRPELFTEKIDVYGYGMTCYEILTGKFPFEGHVLGDKRPLLVDLVINHGLRPEVPDFVDVWAHDLIKRCWQHDPVSRPTFQQILSFF